MVVTDNADVKVVGLDNSISKFRLGGLDILKHLLCICVIYQHTSSSRYSSKTLEFTSIFVVYIDSAVFGFFIISGFLARPVRISFSSSTLYYIISRAKRLLSPFFLFSILYSLLLFLLGKASLVNGLVQTVKLQGAGMQLYFLPYLLFADLCIMTFWTLFRGKRLYLAMFTVGLIAAAIDFGAPTSTGADPRLIPLYLAGFAIGFFARFNSLPSLYLFVLALASFAVGEIFDARFVGLSIVVLLTASALLASQQMPLLQRSFLGSGGAYLLHTPIINYAISIVLLRFGILEVPNFMGTVVLTYLVTTAITLILIHKFRWLRLFLLE